MHSGMVWAGFNLVFKLFPGLEMVLSFASSFTMSNNLAWEVIQKNTRLGWFSKKKKKLGLGGIRTRRRVKGQI